MVVVFASGRGLSAAALAQIEAAAEFKWEDYLLETNSVPSPAKCFKQVSTKYITGLVIPLLCRSSSE